MLHVLNQFHQKLLYPFWLMFIKEKKKSKWKRENKSDSNGMNMSIYCLSWTWLEQKKRRKCYVCVNTIRKRNFLDINLHIYDVNRLIDFLWKYERHYHRSNRISFPKIFSMITISPWQRIGVPYYRKQNVVNIFLQKERKKTCIYLFSNQSNTNKTIGIPERSSINIQSTVILSEKTIPDNSLFIYCHTKRL